MLIGSESFGRSNNANGVKKKGENYFVYFQQSIFPQTHHSFVNPPLLNDRTEAN